MSTPTVRSQLPHLPMLALTLLSLASCAQPTRAQDRLVDLQISTGFSVPVHGQPSATAYDPSMNFGLGIALHVSRSVALRVLFEYHHFYYDRERFFAGLGLYDVDISTQLGAGSQAKDVSVGIQWAPLHRNWYRPYLTAGLGYITQDSDGALPLVGLYCLPPTFTYDGSVLSIPVDWVPPGYCDQAQSETHHGGSGMTVDIGVGTELFTSGTHALLIDVRYLQVMGSTRAGMIPVRIGWRVGF